MPLSFGRDTRALQAIMIVSRIALLLLKATVLLLLSHPALYQVPKPSLRHHNLFALNYECRCTSMSVTVTVKTDLF